MPISLTKDEFHERLAERRKLFQAGVQRDIDQIDSLHTPLNAADGSTFTKITIETIRELLLKAIQRAEDLVYLEDI